MLKIIALFILGFILLIKGADILVEGSASIAKKLGVSSFVIGLTIVAFGTSAPELIVSAMASFKESPGIALGNIIGSNLSNSLLILGVAAIIAPLEIKKHTVTKEIPLSLLAITAVAFLVNDILINQSQVNILSRSDGLILILFFIIFLYYTFGLRKVGIIEKLGENQDGIEEKNIFNSLGMIIGGLAILGVGGKLIVDHGIEIALFFGLSEALVGLTFVAIGTSLPELATSAIAAYKGKSDIAIGNVIGSNIFNFFWVLGLSAAIHPIYYNSSLNPDLLVLFLSTILILLLVFAGRKNILSRLEGSILLFIYLCYLVLIIYRG